MENRCEEITGESVVQLEEYANDRKLSGAIYQIRLELEQHLEFKRSAVHAYRWPHP